MKGKGNLSREFLKKRFDSDTDSRFNIQLMFKLYTFVLIFTDNFCIIIILFCNLADPNADTFG